MCRSARLLAEVIARASRSSSRTAAAGPGSSLLTSASTSTPTAAATRAPAAIPPLPPTTCVLLAARREQPLPLASLDWLPRSYAKGARGGGGGGGGKKGSGGGKKAGGKRGRAAAAASDDDDGDDGQGGDDDDNEDEAGAGDDGEDPLKLDEIESMMKAAIEHYSHELAGVRTGRANPGLIENLQVPVDAPSAAAGGGSSSSSGGGGRQSQHHHHGHAHVPLRALGTVTVRDPQTLAVSVFDPSMAGAVARAIQNSPLGLSAVPGGAADAAAGGGGKKSQQQGGEVLVRLPRMTREVVERMVKLVHAEGEDALVSIRRARQKALDAAKRAYGGSGGGGGGRGNNKSSDLQRAEKAVAALVDKYTGEVDRMKRLKDKELREHRD